MNKNRIKEICCGYFVEDINSDNLYSNFSFFYALLNLEGVIVNEFQFFNLRICC